MWNWPNQPCAGGCGQKVWSHGDLCSDCEAEQLRKLARDDAAVALWANEGFKDIAKYLTAWAAFQAWEANH